MVELRRCSICNKESKSVFRCPDGRDRCVKCAAKYEKYLAKRANIRRPLEKGE